MISLVADVNYTADVSGAVRTIWPDPTDRFAEYGPDRTTDSECRRKHDLVIVNTTPPMAIAQHK